MSQKVTLAVLAREIVHERELREAEKAAVEHERELRAVFVSNERNSRLANETAVEKARQLQYEILEQRLEGMNEFREQLTQQAKIGRASCRERV